MKRSAPANPQASPRSHKKKKRKTSALVAQATVAPAVPLPLAVAFPAITATKGPQGSDPVPEETADAGRNSWTKVEKRRAKKAQKAEAKADAASPHLLYVIAEIVKRREAVSIGDIRELVLHLLGDAPPQAWLRVENPHNITKVVVLLVPGITPDVLGLPPRPTSATSNPNLPVPIPTLPLFPSSKGATQSSTTPTPHTHRLPFIPRTFSHACPTRAPGDASKMHSVLSAFFHGPVSAEERKRRARHGSDHPAEGKTGGGAEAYMLSVSQMIDNEYPVPRYLADVFDKPDDCAETPQAALELDAGIVSHAPAKVFAIDCEMCLTSAGKELTRVCVIDYTTEKVVYDTHVKPQLPILDYLTRWSGITPAALEGVTTTLADVQKALLVLLTPRPGAPTPILLGHSLESDLRALRLCHPACIDTALLYHHPRGRPLKPGLAWLTRKWCGREIQTGGEGGHDPEEDARACIALLRLKIQNGRGFGEFKTDQESIFERLGRGSGMGYGRGAGSGGRSAPVRTAVVDRGHPSTWHGAKASATVACTSDAEVLAGLLETIPGHEFVFGRFTGVADALGWTTAKDVPTAPEAEEGAVDRAFEELEGQLSAVHAALPSGSVLVVLTGHGDPRGMAALNKRKNEFESAMRGGKGAEEGSVRWTSGDGRALEEAVELAKRGLVFLCVRL